MGKQMGKAEDNGETVMISVIVSEHSIGVCHRGEENGLFFILP